ncbi:MAG: PAS domain S-box protein [Pseudomonadota bacterium]
MSLLGGLAAASIIVALAVTLCGCDLLNNPLGRPRARDGQIDLTGWDLQTQGPVKLDGRWAFHWERLLVSDKGPASGETAPSGFISVPGAWNGFSAEGKKIAGLGFATYKLVAVIKPPNGRLALSIPDVFSAHAVFVNGEKIASAGRVGRDPAASVPGLFPRVSFIEPQGNRLEIVLEASNFHHRLGGAIRSIELGLAEDLLAGRDRALMTAFGAFAVILLIGLYHILLFALRPVDRSPFYFGLFCLFISTRPLLEGQRVLLQFVPGLNWELLNKSIYLGLYLAIPCFVFFARSLYPDDIGRRYVRACAAWGAALSLFVLAAPTRAFSYTMPVYQASLALMLGYMVHGLIGAARRRREGALIFLAGFIALFLTALNDILYSREIVNTGYFVPLGSLLFLFAQTFILAQRFARSFSVVKAQSRRILDINQSMIKEMGERRKVEEALRRSEETYRFLVEYQNDMIFRTDLEGRLLFASPSFRRMFDRKESELQGLRILSLVEPEDRELVLQSVEKLLAPPYAVNFEHRSRTAHGLGWLAWSAVGMTDMTGRVFEFIGVGRDVTEKKKAEEALRAQNRLMNTLLENLPVGVLMVKAPDGEPLLANAKALELLGLESMPEATAENMAAVYRVRRQGTGAPYPLDEMPLIRGLRGERSHVDDMVGLDRAGKEIVLEVFGASVKDGDGKVLAGLVSLVDITERKKAEEERIILEAQLRQAHKLEAVGTLTGGIAHDFNNLLQVINGLVELLLASKKQDDPDFKRLSEIAVAGERAAGLVRQLLLFSRKVESERRPLDINKEVEDARRILERTIPKMIAIEVRAGSGLRLVQADGAQLQQVFLNLGNNAAQAMPEGGRLIIETQNAVLEEETPSPAGRERIPDQVAITFSDTGEGMDPETIQHIFEPFFTTKEVGRGTGLGLSSAYGIVKNHGGAITCESQVGRGTTFRILLPASDGPDFPAPPKSREERPRGGTETILLVEDEPAVRTLAKEILRTAGYKVLAVSTGEDALERYSQKDPDIDLVVLDIGLPGMGGRQCLRELFRIDPAVRVLVASGYAVKDELRELADSSRVGFIRKPYRLKDLLGGVRAALD